MAWRIEEVRELRGFSVEWLEPGLVLLSKRNRIYRAGSPTGPRELVGEVRVPRWQRAVARTRLGQRILRFMVYNSLPLPDGSIFVTFDRQVGLLSGTSYRELEGLRRPCRVLRGGCCSTADGSVIWGEYLSNEERGEVLVYRLRLGAGRAEVLYTFGAGQIRHVHGIYRDPFEDALWCVTGDVAGECRILRTKDGFSTFEAVGQGDETWRTVSLRFASDAVYYASDAEFRDNHIYRLHRRTRERTQLASIDGPVYYSYSLGEELFFATTAELCPSQEKAAAVLWHLAPDSPPVVVCTFAKDLFRSRLLAQLLMFGTLHFPGGPGLDEAIYLSGVGLRGLDNRTMRLRRE